MFPNLSFYLIHFNTAYIKKLNLYSLWLLSSKRIYFTLVLFTVTKCLWLFLNLSINKFWFLLYHLSTVPSWLAKQNRWFKCISLQKKLVKVAKSQELFSFLSFLFLQNKPLSIKALKKWQRVILCIFWKWDEIWK